MEVSIAVESTLTGISSLTSSRISIFVGSTRDGLMEVIVLRLGEQARPAGNQSEKHLAAYRLKIATALDRLEAEAPDFAGTPTIGHVAIACALGHMDFRFAADNWRAGRGRLGRWYDEFARRPSMRATEYVDAY